MDWIANYIAELKSPVSLMRKFAARNLRRNHDERAVSPLIDALEDPEAEVRKEAAETLGHIGREEAAGALLKAGSDPDEKVSSAAKKALEKIRKSQKPHSPRAVARPAPGSRSSLMKEALSDTGSMVEEKPYGFKVTVRLNSGRKQQIRVVFDNPDPDGTKLIVMYTVCGPSVPQKYEWALATNARLSFGALAVRKGKNRSEFILLDRVIEHGADPVDIRRRILSLAEKGDAIEKNLTGADAN